MSLVVAAMTREMQLQTHFAATTVLSCFKKKRKKKGGGGGWGVVREAFLQLVSWCFRPSEPEKIISGMKETFIQGYIFIVDRTNKTE